MRATWWRRRDRFDWDPWHYVLEELARTTNAAPLDRARRSTQAIDGPAEMQGDG